jgi:hypothetical protein
MQSPTFRKLRLLAAVTFGFWGRTTGYWSGDALDPSEVARLMAGEAGDLVFSDLPYNCGYQGYTKDKLTIRNDDMSPEQFALFPPPSRA